MVKEKVELLPDSELVKILLSKQAQQLLTEILRDASRPVILFWEIDDIVKATTFKKAFLEEYILPDSRVKQYERKRFPRGKRVWLAEPTAKAIQDIIMNDWY